MTMKESDTVRLWCPMARVARSRADGSFNRDRDTSIKIPFEACCIGNKCAVWVGGQKKKDDHYIFEEKSTIEGHCGLIK